MWLCSYGVVVNNQGKEQESVIVNLAISYCYISFINLYRNILRAKVVLSLMMMRTMVIRHYRPM